MAAGAQQALVVPVLAVGTAAGTTFLLSTSSLQARRAAPRLPCRPSLASQGPTSVTLCLFMHLCTQMTNSM